MLTKKVALGLVSITYIILLVLISFFYVPMKNTVTISRTGFLNTNSSGIVFERIWNEGETHKIEDSSISPTPSKVNAKNIRTVKTLNTNILFVEIAVLTLMYLTIIYLFKQLK
jgi:hypothetical protein